MSIDHLEGYCKFKKLLYKGNETKGINLDFDAIKMQPDEEIKVRWNEIKPNFDDYGARKEFAIAQLVGIQQYIAAFEQIVKKCKEESGDGVKRNAMTNKA